MAVETFTIPWVRAHKRKISFKTDIDGEYTAHEQRNALWTNPRRSWTLSFEKSPDDMAAIQAFFIARRGKWSSFNWVYSATDKYGRPTGGDGVTYLVRFDTDDLEEAIQSGYSTFDIPIVEVVTSE
jgi:hypothetical protein